MEDKPTTLDALHGLSPTPGEPNMSPNKANPLDPSIWEQQDMAFKSSQTTDPNSFAKVHAFGANHRGQNFQRYYSHPSFSKLGFDPYIDNESKYNANSSWTDDWQRAVPQFFNMAGRAAWDNATGFFNLSMDGNTEASAAMEKSMSIANSSRGGVGGFVTNLAGNSAYTFGIFGEMLLEEAALVGLDAVTGGGGLAVHGPAEARHAMQLGKLGSVLSHTRDIFRSINTAQDARTFWNTAKAAGKGVLNVLNPLENTTKLLMQGDRLAGMTDAARAANSISEFAKMKNGVGAFYRDLRAMRSVLTESQLEGGFTETDTYDELSRNFYEKNGRLPEGREAEQIAAQAKSAGRATAFLNMPAIFLTNKIVLEQAVRGIGPKAVMRELETAGFSRTMFYNKGFKEAGKEAFEFGAKGVRTLGTAQYWKNLPKAIAKGSLRYSAANFAEGLQESIQEGLQVGVKNYYLNQMEHPDREGSKLNSALMWDSVSKGVKSQFSAQGAEVFASGFLMGTMMQGPKFLLNQSIKQYMKFTKPEQFKALRDQKEKAEQQVLDAMNDLYKDPAKYFEAITSGMTDQLDIHALMDEVEGDQKVSRDGVDEALLKHVHTLFHSGKTDLLIEQLSSLKELNPTELKEAFGMQADDPIDLHQRIDNTIGDVKTMVARFKAVNENFTNPFNPKLYKQGTEEYNQEVIGFHGWRGAQLQVVFNRRAFDQALDRMDSISNTALGNSGLSNVNALDYSLVFDEENSTDEMRNLVKQIPILAQGDAEARKESRKLKKKLSALVEFHTARDNYKKVAKEIAAAQARNEKAKEAGTQLEKIDNSAMKLAQRALKKSYNAYLKRITKPGTFNLDENTAKSFTQYIDFLRLSDDAQAFATVVNQFHNPEAFTRLAQVHADTLAVMHENRRKHVEKSLKKWLKKKSTNELVALLTDEGIYFEPESMLVMLDNNTIPEVFYDAVGHQPITKDSPKHKKAVEIIDKWMQGEGRVAAVPAIVTAAPVASAQMTGSTEKALRDKYAEAVAADPEVANDYPTFEDWLGSTTAKTLLNTLQPAPAPVAPSVIPSVTPTPAVQASNPAALTFEQALLTKLLGVAELKGNGNRSKREDIVKSLLAHDTLMRATPTFMNATADMKKKSLTAEIRKIMLRNGIANNEPLIASIAAIMLTELGVAVPAVQNTPVPLPLAPPIAPVVPAAPATPIVQTDAPNVGDVVTVISPFADDEDFPNGFKEMRIEEVKPVRDKTGKLTGGYVRAIPTDPNDKMGSLSPISLMDETDYHIGQPPVVEVIETPEVVAEEIVPAVPINRTVQQVIDEVKENASFITLSPDGKSYVNQRTGQLYNRVTSVISEVKGTNALLESASHIGTNLDNIVRDFFEGKPTRWSDYTNRIPVTKKNQMNLKAGDQLVDASGAMFTVNAVNKTNKTVSIKGDKGAVSGDLSIGEYFLVSPMIEDESVFNSFVAQLKDLQKQFDANREQVLSSGIVLYNDQMGLAGTVDIMTVNDRGVVRIYDMKTMRDNNFETQAAATSDLSKYDYVYPGDTLSKREKHQAQLSLYRMLLANTHGLVAQNLEVIPIQVSYNAGDVTTKEAKILPLVALDPLDSFSGLQINPKVLEASQPDTLYDGKEDLEKLRMLTPAERKAFGPEESVITLRDKLISIAKFLKDHLRWSIEDIRFSGKQRILEVDLQGGEKFIMPNTHFLQIGGDAGQIIPEFEPEQIIQARVTALDSTPASETLDSVAVEQPEIQLVQPQIEVQDTRLDDFNEVFGEQPQSAFDVNTLVIDHAQVSEELAALERGEGVTPMEQVIVDMGGIATTKDSFKEAADAHLMKGMVPAYFKGSETLDQIAKGILENGTINLDEAGVRDALLQFMLDYPGGIGSVNSTSDRTFHGSMNQRKVQIKIQLKDIEAQFKKETGISISAYLSMEDSRRTAMMTDDERRIASRVANAASLDELAQVEQDAMEAFSTGDTEAIGDISSIEISTMLDQREEELTPVVDEITAQDQSLANQGYASQVAADNIDELIKEAEAMSMNDLLQKMKDEKLC